MNLAVIFDFGNVIAYFDFGKATARLAPKLGLSSRELLDRLRSPEYQSLHASFERGEFEPEVFSGKFADLTGLRVTHHEFTKAWADIFTPNDSVVPILAGLRSQGYPLILGSNTNAIHAAYFRQQFASTLGLFDQLICSYEIGVMKPDPAFYLACATAAGLSPEHCLFIDDLAENIAGANAVGMQGIVYTDNDSLEADLGARGVRWDGGR